MDDIMGLARRPRGRGFSPWASSLFTRNLGPSVSKPRVGRLVGGLEDSRPLSRRPEGLVPPTPSVLAVTVRPIEVIQDSGSSDGEPLVRPNNGREVVSRIGDPNISGRFSILSDDTQVLDALEEDLERPRLRLEDSGSQWDPSEDDLPLSSVGRTRRRFPQATQRDSGAEFPRQSEGSDGFVRASSRTLITERDSPDSHDQRLQRVRQAMQSRVQGDPNAMRESANVHRRLASEVDSSTSGPESEAGIESEEDPEDLAVEVEPARPAAVRAALLALDEYSCLNG